MNECLLSGHVQGWAPRPLHHVGELATHLEEQEVPQRVVGRVKEWLQNRAHTFMFICKCLKAGRNSGRISSLRLNSLSLSPVFSSPQLPMQLARRRKENDNIGNPRIRLHTLTRVPGEGGLFVQRDGEMGGEETTNGPF